MAGGVERSGERQMDKTDDTGREKMGIEEAWRGQLPPDANVHRSRLFSRIFAQVQEGGKQDVLGLLCPDRRCRSRDLSL